MNTTSHLFRANLRAHSRRYIATGIAIAISLIFVTLALNFAAGMKATLLHQALSSVHGSAVVVSGGDSHADLREVPDRVRSVEGVKQVQPSVQAFARFNKGEARFSQIVTNTLPEPFTQATILEGKLPAQDDEILLSHGAASSLEAKLGDTISLKPGGSDAVPSQVRVVGIADESFVGTSDSYMTIDGIRAHNLDYSTTVVLVEADFISDGNDAIAEQHNQLAHRVRDALAALPEGREMHVASYEEAVKELQEEVPKVFGSVFIGMLVFPAIAGVVALIVVHSTFQVILHQRTRDMALLRAIGARSGQLRSMILAETLTVGAVASAMAVLIGSILSAVVLSLMKMTPSFISAFTIFSPVTLLVVFTVGTLLTVLVGIRPALGAARISPMAALSPVEDSPLRSRPLPRIRIALASLVLLSSLGGMYVMAGLEEDGQRFVGLVGLSFVALISTLILTAVALPYLTRLLGCASGSMLSQMARENTARNPRRTSATGTAIIIGVTLMVTMMVGASSMKTTLSAELDNRRPMDFEVALTQNANPDVVEREIAQLAHVTNTLKIEQVYATVGDLGELVVAGQPDLTPVMHSPKPMLQPGQISFSDEDVASVGQTYTITNSDGASTTFTVTDQRSYLEAYAVVPAEDLKAFDGPRITRLVAMIDDPSKASEISSKIESIEGVEFVTGSAVERQMFAELISAVLNVVLALVGVSVLVSVVGVSNTLNLSVRERTRENGLLRALGLTRRQMRRLLTIEAILIALTATTIGTALGIFFAWVGMYALPLRIAQIYLSLPWLQLGAMIVVALLSAILASVLPGRKAAKVSPVEALATQ